MDLPAMAMRMSGGMGITSVRLLFGGGERLQGVLHASLMTASVTCYAQQPSALDSETN